MPFRAGSWANAHSALVTFSFIERGKDVQGSCAISLSACRIKFPVAPLRAKLNARWCIMSQSYFCKMCREISENYFSHVTNLTLLSTFYLRLYVLSPDMSAGFFPGRGIMKILFFFLNFFIISLFQYFYFYFIYFNFFIIWLF